MIMSDFLNQPEDNFKNLIDDFFVDKTKESTAKQKTNRPNRRLKSPDLPPIPVKEEGPYVKKAVEEMERVRQSFLDFQSVISETVVYPYLFPHIEEFAYIAQDLVDLIGDNIDHADLTEQGLEDYERMLQIRNRILHSIKDKYFKE